MTFRVGQKVCCIRTKWFEPPMKGEVFPVLGGVYTIREIVRCADEGPAGLKFYELTNPRFYDGTDCDFRADNFRPIVERKTDISIFTQMLNPSKVEANA